MSGHCREIKEGHGYKQECLNPNFVLYPDGRIGCSLCGKVYADLEELQAANAELASSKVDPSKTCDGCSIPCTIAMSDNVRCPSYHK